MIVWILNSPPLHKCSIVQCVDSVGEMNCFAACLLTAKTCAHFFRVIREHLTHVIFPFAVHGAIQKTECPPSAAILFFELLHNFVPFFPMIPAGYHRKNGAGLCTRYSQGGWLEHNWVHTPLSNNTRDIIDFNLLLLLQEFTLSLLCNEDFLLQARDGFTHSIFFCLGG